MYDYYIDRYTLSAIKYNFCSCYFLFVNLLTYDMLCTSVLIFVTTLHSTLVLGLGINCKGVGLIITKINQKGVGLNNAPSWDESEQIDSIKWLYY